MSAWLVKYNVIEDKDTEHETFWDDQSIVIADSIDQIDPAIRAFLPIYSKDLQLYKVISASYLCESVVSLDGSYK